MIYEIRGLRLKTGLWGAKKVDDRKFMRINPGQPVSVTGRARNPKRSIDSAAWTYAIRQ